jgi:PBSX family phage portal protein
MATKAPKRGPVTRARTIKAQREELNVRSEVSRVQASRDAILKAHTFSARQESGVQKNPDEADQQVWEGVGAIVPPYEPFVLLTLLEHSNSLRQCVDAYVTNIDAHGHRFEPIIDLNSADADDRIRTYLLTRAGEKDPSIIADPTRQAEVSDDTVQACKKELAEKMRVERVRLEHFFEYASLDQSFVALRRQTRQDIEAQGNGYWEVIRSEDGKIAGFEYVPAFTVRHFAADKTSTTIVHKVKENEFDFGTIEARKFFRRFVQVFESRVVWFKEFGDPRVVSRRSGAYYKSAEDLERSEKHKEAASEMLHFRVHTSKSSYGIPRWVGCLLSVIGSRQAEEVNLSYFENKSVPPLAVLVSGGRISNNTVDRIKDFIENDIKGKRNFHKLLVLEAEGPAASGFDQGRMRIDLKPLTAAQHNDALFQGYDQSNIDKVGMAFRLPRMLRGDIRDFNRATAEAALEFAEQQVFKPERDDFDFTMNRKVLPVLGIRFWRFVSNSAAWQNPNDRAEILSKLGTVGFITPAEGRDLAEAIFNRPLQKITAPWVRQPLQLTLAGITPPDELMAPGMVSPQTAATGVVEGAPAPALPGAPQTAATVAPAAGAPAGGTLTLTGTDAASIVTVNEGRESVGRGPLMTPDGQPDPDGFLTITEFKAKRMAAGQALGVAQGQADGAGLAPAASGAAPPEQKRDKDFSTLAMELLRMRKAFEIIDTAEAEAAFTAAKAREEAAE